MGVPPQVKIFAVVGLAALRAKQGHGYALWTLARAIDDGSGRVALVDLRAAATALRWPAHQWRRALQQAQAGKMITNIAGHAFLASLLRVCRHYGLPTAGRCPVMVPSDTMRLLSVWKSALWGAYHASRAPRSQATPISRRSLEAQTGVDPRTQQRLDRKAKIKKTNSFKALTPHQTAHGYSAVVREDNSGRRCFEKDGRVWVQASNIYTSPYQPARRGMCRKLPRLLRSDLLNTHDGQRNGQRRSYYDTYEKAEAAARRRTGTNGIPTAFQRDVPVFWRVSAPNSAVALFLPVG